VDAAPSVWHVSAIPTDLTGRDAVAPSLDVIARELEPLVATFFTIGADSEIEAAVAHGSHLPPVELAEEVRSWKARLHGIDPLAPAKIARLPRRVATLADVGGTRRAVLDKGLVRATYEEIGVINDVQLLIRDGDRLLAGVTLWRSLRSSAWTSDQLRLLYALHPLIEMAYLACAQAASGIDARLPGTLTPRQRQVAGLLASGATNREIARALYISPDTVKSHVRAVLSNLGVTSRRELVMRLTRVGAESSPGAARGRPASDDLSATPRSPGRQRGEPPIRSEGDQAPQRLLTAVLDWSAQRIGAVIGGCAFFSTRFERVAEAWGIAPQETGEADPRVAWRVHRQVLPPTSPSELVRYLDDAAARSPVVELDVSGPAPSDDRLAELVASLGLTSPLVAVLRLRGRVAGLIWLCRDAGAALDQRESALALRGVHPLVELTQLVRLADRRRPESTPVAIADVGLTPRETEVARLALEGKGNAAIASRLSISEATVKQHMFRILAKCGVRSRTELIVLFGARIKGD
jgi:DNA-binding NarL/FixJ family response regulator